jgi:hypothetical protein
MLALVGIRDKKASDVGVGVRLCVILEQLFTVNSTVQSGYLFTVLAAIKVKNTKLTFLYASSIMCGMPGLLTLINIYINLYYL